MAEKKGVGHAYNVDFLNVVFAASSIFLFLSTIWMVWDDYNRDWKNTQRQFNELELQVTRASQQKAAAAVDKNKLKQLQDQKAAAEKNVTANQAKLDELNEKLADVEKRMYRANQNYQFAKATYDVNRYDFEVKRAEGHQDPEHEKEIGEEGQHVNELNLELEKVTAERNEVQKQQGEIAGKAGEIQKEIDALTAEERRLQRRGEVIAPSFLKTYFRDAPMLDFLAPTIRVNQILLPNVVDDVNFTKVAKMDRCTTCHLGIDKKGYESYPQPFKTHPNLSAFLGSDSPHPMDQIGCTACHEGLGQSVSFRDASHMPRDAKQKAEWEEKYHWEEPHMWDYPMLPTQMTEASCAKCHKREVYVPQADKLGLAYATYERAGCYACHKTRGFEDVRKPGPILTKIDSKLTADWVKNWIRNPRAVKPATWMPRVWYNSNSSSPADAVRNEAEIEAVVAYLFANTTPYQNEVKSPPRGDAKSGEQIVKAIGCQGCHVAGEGKREEVGPHRTFGQPLENLGNKTTYEWVYNWVRDPKHYNPGTYMPDLRLTDGQAADVATYLMTLKGPGGDGPKATPDQAAVDAVLMDYLRAVMPSAEAKAQLDKMDPKTKQLTLGEKAISRYGCFSCHEIKGFETAQPIGTELSEEGSKLVTRLDFAFQHDLPHTSKIAWFERKLHDPRSFDEGRILQPLDKLRMPNFEFSPLEKERLLTAIMSFQREIQPLAAMPAKTARADLRSQGRNLVHRRNCVGCHIIEGSGGDFLKTVAEPSLGPPTLTPEGARVQPEWLYAFLREPIQIRPWLDVRMPTFGLDDRTLSGIIQYFGAVSNQMTAYQRPVVVNTSADLATGKALFELLKCQMCHVLGAIPKDQPTANLAPDLRMVPDRLQPDWIIDWLKTPARILPGTRMPAFWPDHPKSPFPQLNGDAEAQIRAIRDYLLTFKGGPSPRGNRAAASTN